MEKILSEFIRELTSSFGIPMHTVTLPCVDWSWLDMGLRKNLFGSVECGQINQGLADYEDTVVYNYVDLFQCHYTSLRIPDCDEYIFFGPLLFENISGLRFDTLFQSLKLPETMRKSLQNYYYTR